MEKQNNFNDDGFDNDFHKEQEEQVEAEVNNNKAWNKNQKIAIAGLGLLTILVFVFWISQLNSRIKYPFSYENALKRSENQVALNNQEKPASCSGPNCGQFSEEQLKLMDTDGDGLNDWEELYVYGTSPYLEDTDGDGISDYDEVRAGTDPNCPEGQDCQVMFKPVVSTSTAESPFFNLADESGPDEAEVLETIQMLQMLQEMGYDDNLKMLENQNLSSVSPQANSPSLSSGEDEKLLQLLSGQIDATSLRQALADAGMPADVLSAVSDEELLASYQEILAE